MRTPASIAGHPIHPMLVPIAIGGFVLSFAADLICLATGVLEPWRALAHYTMVGGIIGALAAAVPGFIDLLSLPAGAVKRTAITHMMINLTVVALYAWNAFMRYADPEPGRLPVLLSLLAILMLLVSGWLGGKMVFAAGVGVDTGEQSRK
jgi:uncharacterized membrane protein